MIEQQVITVLNTTPEIQAAVGQRIYALVRPQGDPLPAIVWQRVSTEPINSLQGFSGLDNVRLQFACYAETLLAAKQLAQAVSVALNGANTLKCTRTMEMDGQDPETRNFRVIIDFNIWQRS
jgi:hypothetical protein